MIRFADILMEQQLKQLWKEVFGDTDAFIDLYFKGKYKPHYTLVEETGGVVSSTIQMLAYPMSFFGYHTTAAYISGAATKESQREHGHMRNLLHTSFHIMLNRQQMFSILIPAQQWLYGYYQRFGYAESFYLKKETIDVSGYVIGDSIDIKKFTDNDQQALLKFYCEYWKDSDFSVQKTQDDLKVVLNDHLLGGGNILLAYVKNQLVGVSFAIEQNGCLVKELLGHDQGVCSSLLKAAAQIYNCEAVTLLSKPDQPNKTGRIDKLGMARIIRLFDALTLFAKANAQTCAILNIRDDIIAINSGVYQIKNGTCLKLSPKVQTGEVWNMEQTMLWMMGQISGSDDITPKHMMYMNLMLN